MQKQNWKDNLRSLAHVIEKKQSMSWMKLLKIPLVPSQYIHQLSKYVKILVFFGSIPILWLKNQKWANPKTSFVNCIYLAAPTWLIFSGLIELAKLQMKLYQEFQNFATRWCQLICLLFGFSLFIFFPETAELISLQIIKILCTTQLLSEKKCWTNLTVSCVFTKNQDEF